MRKVLENQSYRERARYFQKVIAETRGLEVAADRIEQAFQTSQRRLRSLLSDEARSVSS